MPWALLVAATNAATAPVPAPEPWGREIDGMSFVLETVGHIPASLPIIERSTETIPMRQLRPFVHEVTAAYGVGVRALRSEVILRAGYRFAGGTTPAGSEVDNVDVADYALSAVPITVGWRMTLFPYVVQLLLGVDLGGSIADVSFTPVGGGEVASGFGWQWGLRGMLGAQINVLDWLGVRLFVEGRFEQGIQIDGGPTVDPSGFGFGLALVATTGVPEPDDSDPATLADDSEGEDGEPLLKTYEGAGESSRLDRAFEVIREADDAKRRRDFIDAEKLYRRAVGRLPRDSETRRNVESPVRADWGICLVEIGRFDEAIEVLKVALELDPNNSIALDVLMAIDPEALNEPDGAEEEIYVP